MTLHEFLDCRFGVDGDEVLRHRLAAGEELEARSGDHDETLLHVAVRRRRESAVGILLDHGADINAKTAGGKTGYAHAARRGFSELVRLLEERGADTELSDADRFAVAIVTGRLDEARRFWPITPA